MSIKPTLQIGDPRLKAKNKRVTSVRFKVVKQIIEDLKDTMRKQELIGMAAPQIGYNWQIFVTELRKTAYRRGDQTDVFRVYINPKIIFFSKEQSVIYEGCGSVNQVGEFGPVRRSALVAVEALDKHGQKFQLRCNGILARVIQHEYDHLEGIEFIEKVTDSKKMVPVEFYREHIKDSPEQAKASKISVLEYKEL